MRKIIVEATGKHGQRLPRILQNVYYGSRQPKVNEPVIVTTKDDEILADNAKVAFVNDRSKTYDVQIW
jgi:hypothetical protein